MFAAAGADLGVRAPDLVHMDNVTGLIVPSEGSRMMLSSGQTVEVPGDFFLHPQTGAVLPIQGNVSYDTVSSKLIFTVDSAIGKGWADIRDLCLYL